MTAPLTFQPIIHGVPIGALRWEKNETQEEERTKSDGGNRERLGSLEIPSI